MNLFDTERFLVPGGRPRELAVGLLAGLLSLLFLYLATYVLVVAVAKGFLEPPLLDRGKLEFLLVPGVLLVLGLPGAWVAFRLLAARPRRDGGLMSPLMLRLGGVLMFGLAVVLVATRSREPRTWPDTVTLVTAGAACWVLAQRREPHDAAGPVTRAAANTPIE